MRLICPTCNAQYEVADNVIPEGGRDVQCSNCGTTWFQKPVSDIRPAKPVVAPRRPAQEDEPRWQAETQEDAPPRPAPASRVSDDAASILREEAMRELKARLSERPAVETQTDFGLMPPIETPRRPRPEPVEAEVEAPAPSAKPAPAPRPAPERPAPAAQAPKPAPVPAPTGRNRLPDIEEVVAAHPAEAGGASVAANAAQTAYRRSFRLGFGLSLVAGLAAFAAYVYAPQISVRVPQVAPALAAYVAKADVLRGKLDVLVKHTLGATPGA